MGSKRKKAQKQKDFVKPKLKVGKTQAKPDNYTDTSFIAKSISLPNQSLNKKTPTPVKRDDNRDDKRDDQRDDIDLTHQLSLTKHHSSNTRKEVLVFIDSHLPANPTAYKAIISSITPMITDESLNVRTTVVQLLKSCVAKQPGLLALHIRPLTLFIHAAMSHIQPDIRNTSTKFLQVLIDHAARPLIQSYFIKTLKNYFTLMAWTLKQDKKSVSLAITTSAAIGGSTKRARIHHLQILKNLLQVALFAPDKASDSSNSVDWSQVVVLHGQTPKYWLPDVPQSYAPLKLFIQEMPKPVDSSDTGDKSSHEEGKFGLDDLNSLTTEDLDTRRKVMADVFMEPMVKNLNNLVKEGGEVGREANSCLGLISQFKQDMTASKD